MAQKHLISNVYIERGTGPGFWILRTKNKYSNDGKVVLHESAISRLHAHVKRAKKKLTKPPI
jgi:hypothetical protein